MMEFEPPVWIQGIGLIEGVTQPPEQIPDKQGPSICMFTIVDLKSPQNNPRGLVRTPGLQLASSVGPWS